MEFYGHIGCFDEEKLIGTRFSVSATLTCEIGDAAETDDLAQTVNYQSVYAAIKSEMAPKANLLESVALRIIRRLKHDFPAIERVELSLSKLNPMLAAGGKIHSVTVTFEE